MRALQKLVRNGSSTQVTIPRPMLIANGWLPSEAVIVELLDDHSIRIRRPSADDFAPVRMPRLQMQPADASAK